MLSETLIDGLESYRIGARIRALRNEKGLALAQLGEHTGLSAGMLSKLERGQIYPRLPTLLRIALVFGVGLDHFFVDPVEPTLEIVRRKDRIRLPNTAKSSPTFMFESLDFPVPDRILESFLAEFLPRRRASDPHSHPGVELTYVISGRLSLSIHRNIYGLEAGDSIYFDADFEHSYKCDSEDPCQCLVVVTKSEGDRLSDFLKEKLTERGVSSTPK